jgi:periplasmic protein TonB
MSYAQRKELSGNRTMSIIFTAIVVGGLMYAIVTGLAYNVIKKTAENLKVVDVEEPPPPPEKPPPPPKDMPKVPPPPMTPPPLVRMNTTPPPIQVVESPVIPPPQPIQPVIHPPPPPTPPPAPRQSQARSLTGSLQGLIGNDDYPPSAIDNNEQGTVVVNLTIGPSGRVTGCSPSGSASSTLKTATCRLLTARARFSPAQDANGNPVSSNYSQTIKWVLAD